MERETGLEPATSSLGKNAFIESKSLMRFCSDFLNLQRLSKSAFSRSVTANEAQTRQHEARLGERAPQIQIDIRGNLKPTWWIMNLRDGWMQGNGIVPSAENTPNGAQEARMRTTKVIGYEPCAQEIR